MVTNSSGGAVLAGATITTMPATSTATTDAQGTYAMTVPVGNYYVIFSAKSFNTDFAGSLNVSTSGVTANRALIPVPAITDMDLFSRPDRTWPGTASDGHVWKDDLNNYPTAKASISGRMLYVQTAAQLTDYDNWMGDAWANEQVSVDFDMVTVIQDPAYQHGARLLANVQSDITWIELAINEVNGTLALWVVYNGQWTEIQEANVSTTTHQWYHSKLYVWGNTVAAKVWAVGTAEPGWQITATQNILGGSGVGGLRTTASDVYYQNFQTVKQ